MTIGGTTVDCEIHPDQATATCSMNNIPVGPGYASASILCTGQSCDNVGNCTPVSSQTSVPFVADTAPPLLTLDTAPVTDTILPLAPILFSGTLASYSSATVSIYLGTSTTPNFPGLLVSTTWSLVVDTPTLMFLITNIPAPKIQLGVYATDLLGYSAAFSTVPPSNGSPYLDPTLARVIYIDSAPPTVTLEQGTTGFLVKTSTSLTVLSGFIYDNLELGSLTLAIQDLGDGIFDGNIIKGPSSRYWDSAARQFSRNNPPAVNITIDKSNGVLEGQTSAQSPWKYNGLTDRYLLPGNTYIVSAVATDYAGNVSTNIFAFKYSPLNAATKTPAPSMAFVSGVTFSPSNQTLQWGGYDLESITVNIPDDFAQLDLTQTGPPCFVASSADGAVAFNDGNGNISSSISFCGTKALLIQSGPSSCLPSGVINVSYQGEIVASASIAIKTPNYDTATPRGPEACPANRRCEYAYWYINFKNDAAINYLYSRESVSILGSGGSGAMCPIDNLDRGLTPGYAGINDDGNSGTTDKNGYTWDPSKFDWQFKNCGMQLNQGWSIYSFWPNPLPVINNGEDIIPYAICTFITNDMIYKHLDNSGHICVSRSDDPRQIKCE